MGITKKHADFQNSYRRSSNFHKRLSDESFKPDGKGSLKLSNKKESELTLDKEKIADAMDKFRERTEQTPGGEQTDN